MASTDVLQLAQAGELTVRVLGGEDVVSAKPADKVETVAKLLAPLETKDVPSDAVRWTELQVV